MNFRAPLLAGLVFSIVTSTALFAEATVGTNGRYLNGSKMNGRYLNSSLLNGGTAGGITLQPATKNGVTLPNVYVEGSELVSRTMRYMNGRFFTREDRGAFFENVELPVSAVDPATGSLIAARLRVEHYELVPGTVRPNGLIMNPYARYMVSLVVPPAAGSTTSTYLPICQDAAGNALPAIAMAGEWNYGEGQPHGGEHFNTDKTRVTFACTNAAMGKCAEMYDYKPWETEYVEKCVFNSATRQKDCKWVNQDMTDTHVACTRMVRADYCGDGVSHTVDGTEIEVWDDLGGEPQSGGGLLLATRHNLLDVSIPSDAWQYEASWISTGATKLACERLHDTVPSCPVYKPAGDGWIALPNYAAYSTTVPWSCSNSPEISTLLAGDNAVIATGRHPGSFFATLSTSSLGHR